MRRNVGRHTNRDTTGTVDQHVREAGRQNCGFLILAVVVVLEIDGFHADIVQQVSRRFVHADLGVTHGGCVIAVHRTEVALTIQKRQGHREILRHTDQRVIDRAVAVGVVFTHDIAHRTGRFAIRLVVAVTRFMHRIKDAAVHRFQTVPKIGNRTADDHAHGVIEVRCLHLMFDGDRRAIIRGAFGPFFFFVFRGFWPVGHFFCPPVVILYVVGSYHSRGRIWGATYGSVRFFGSHSVRVLTYCFC